MTREELKSVLLSYERALNSFKRALDEPKSEWVRDSAIQRFEYTFEIAWKSIKRFAQKEDMECHSPLQSFRTAFKLGWIEDDKIWLEIRDDRNRTSHTYNEETAEEIYSHLKNYEPRFSNLLRSFGLIPRRLRRFLALPLIPRCLQRGFLLVTLKRLIL